MKKIMKSLFLTTLAITTTAFLFSGRLIIPLKVNKRARSDENFSDYANKKPNHGNSLNTRSFQDCLYHSINGEFQLPFQDPVSHAVRSESGEMATLFKEASYLMLWGFNQKIVIKTFGFNSPISSASFSPNGFHLVVGSKTGDLCIHNYMLNQNIWELATRQGQEEIKYLDFSPDGQIIIACTETYLSLYKYQNQSNFSLNHIGGEYIKAQISPDNQLLAYINNNGHTLTLRKLEESINNELHLEVDEMFITSLLFSPNSTSILIGLSSGELVQYNIQENRIESCMIFNAAIQHMEYDPNFENMLAVYCSNRKDNPGGYIHFISLVNKDIIQSIPIHQIALPLFRLRNKSFFDIDWFESKIYKWGLC